MTPPLPDIDDDQVIQVTMLGAFYNASLKPLLAARDLFLIRVPGTVQEDEAGLLTFVMGVGDSHFLDRVERFSDGTPKEKG